MPTLQPSPTLGPEPTQPAPELRQMTPPPPPTSSPAPPFAPTPPPPAPSRFWNRLISDGGSLDVSVGIYSDCSGRTVLTRSQAQDDICELVPFCMGHNSGVFTPLLHMGVGAVITWWDGGGSPHRYRVFLVREWYRSVTPTKPYLPAPGSVAQFQFCVSADGSESRLFDAAPA